MDFPEVMTLQQAADFLQLHYQTLWEMVKDKKIPAKKVGGSWRIMKKDLIEYFNKS
jgi:excisionase family DNA binding protein